MRTEAQKKLAILLALLDNKNIFSEIPAGPWSNLLSLQNNKTDFQIICTVHTIFFEPTKSGITYNDKILQGQKNISNPDHHEKYKQFLEILNWFKNTFLREEEKQKKEMERKRAEAIAAATPPPSATTSPQACFLRPPVIQTPPPDSARTHNPEHQSLIRR